MKLATIRTGAAGTVAARLDEDDYVELPYRDVRALLEAGLSGDELLAITGPRHPAATAELATLVPNPDKIICLGLNYATHIAEMGRPTPQYPTLFAKYRGALIGPQDPVALPAVSDQVDWEAELGVVIGRSARKVSADEALAYVGGYTVVNDVTVRDWQHRTREFLSGKTFESTTPVGPWLVTPDELPPGAAGLDISCSVNGELMQSSNTSDLLFDVATIIAYVSQIITLLPGDLIATGTPGGVGAGRDPKVFLAPGQVLTTRIQYIGELANVCVHETHS